VKNVFLRRCARRAAGARHGFQSIRRGTANSVRVWTSAENSPVGSTRSHPFDCLFFRGGHFCLRLPASRQPPPCRYHASGRSSLISFDVVATLGMVLSVDEAAGLVRKWQEEEAHILAVSESPFQQSRRGTVEQRIDWKLALQGKVALDQNGSREKACRMVLESPTGTLSLSVDQCVFVYEEPAVARPVVREEAQSTTVCALSVFFPSEEVFVFYELREPLSGRSIPGWSTI
jgi:hypothetical protein